MILELTPDLFYEAIWEPHLDDQGVSGSQDFRQERKNLHGKLVLEYQIET